MANMINFCDKLLIGFARKAAMPFARFSLFVVFFWFGILKVLGTSPANPLVTSLLEETMQFIGAGEFIFIFGIFEMIIGLSFLWPRLIRISIALLAFHMITTFMPLVLLPQMAWQKILVPTLEGQYIIKNLVIIATAMAIGSHIHIKHSN